MPKTANKPIIAVDIDDVLAATTDAVRRFVNHYAKASLSEAHYRVDAPYWGYYEHVWKTNRLEALDLLDKWHNKLGSNQDDILPMTGSIQVLKKFQNTYDLIAITSREPFMKRVTEHWIKKHYDGIFKDIVYVGFAATAAQTKGEACVKAGAVWLIDDNLEHCKDAIKVGVKAVLFGDYGWQGKDKENMVHCKNWKEVERFFNEKS